jgi:hypothetical protein
LGNAKGVLTSELHNGFAMCLFGVEVFSFFLSGGCKLWGAQYASRLAYASDQRLKPKSSGRGHILQRIALKMPALKMLWFEGTWLLHGRLEI